MGDEYCEHDVAAPLPRRVETATDSTPTPLGREALSSAVRMAIESPGPTIARGEGSTRVRRSAVSGPVVGEAGGPVTADVEHDIRRAQGGGNPLAASDRELMEGALGTDLGSIRIHTGSRAARLNEQVGATAFTLGNDVFFRDGAPNTATPAGQHLLAHELAHTLQSGDDVNRVIRRTYVVCTKKQAASDTDFFEVDDPKQKNGKRRVYWRKKDAPDEGHEFVKSGVQPSFWAWGTTSVYDEVETAQHRQERERLEETRRQQQRNDEEKQRKASEQQREQQQQQQRELERQRDVARSKMSWFGSYRSKVEETHERNRKVIEAKLDDSVVNAIEDSLSRIPASEQKLTDAWKRCLQHTMGPACAAASVSSLTAGRPAPDGAHGNPDKDIAKRVGQYVTGLDQVTKRVETFITEWCEPLAADAPTLVGQFGTPQQAQSFIVSLGGVREYQHLRSRNVTVAAMVHYGPNWLSNFRGVTDETMSHLTQAGINSDGDISGGHDADAFDQFIDEHPAYSVTRSERIAAGVTKKTWTGPQGTGGTKTVIDGLADDVGTWKQTLSDAVWAAIAAQMFPAAATTAITAFPQPIDGLRYRFFFDGTKISTLFPVGR